MTWLRPGAGPWLASFPLLAGLIGSPPRAEAQVVLPPHVLLPPGMTMSRQVTLFAIHAIPGGTETDPKLKAIAPQLRRLMPNHGFQLVNVQSSPLRVNQSITCKVSDQLGVKADLVSALGPDGKVQFRFALVDTPHGMPLATTIISTPPNQLFFCDKVLDDGTKVLIGIGAR